VKTHNDYSADTHSLEIGIGHQLGVWDTTGSSCWTSPLLHRCVICCNTENSHVK